MSTEEDAGHFVGLAALGPQARLVVISRAHWTVLVDPGFGVVDLESGSP
jgi:hypothetical protein